MKTRAILNERPKIVVVGSLNVDHTLRVPRMPERGETLAAHGALTCFGGKGANQALAAARAGGEVALIGCVGDDDSGRRYLDYLRGEGIRTDGLVQAEVPTGSAFILVDDSGENSIVYHAGANGALSTDHVDAHAALIGSAAALLLQLECPLPTVFHAARIAAAKGVPVILNASPLTAEFLETGLPCDTLIVNEHEAVSLTALTLDALQADPRRALGVARCRQLIVTRGGDPTLVVAEGETLSIPPPKVIPVDTVGAGDAFAGAFAVASAGGAELVDAIRLANAAGALATQMVGAQSSIPRREEIVRFLASCQA